MIFSLWLFSVFPIKTCSACLKKKLTETLLLNIQWRSQNAEKKYAHKRETTGLRSDSLQLPPFSKWELLLRNEFAPRGRELVPLRAVPYGMEIFLPH